MDGVTETDSDPTLSVFPSIFTLLEAHQGTSPQTRLERIVMLHLGERLPVPVCIETPETHIRVLWGTHFFTSSFTRPTPEDGKFLAFAWDIQMGNLPYTVKMVPAWMDLNYREVLQEANMETVLSCLPPATHRLPEYTPNPERVLVIWHRLHPSNLCTR